MSIRPRRRARRAALALGLGLTMLGGAAVWTTPATAAVFCGFTVNDVVVAKVRSYFGQNLCPTTNTSPTPNGKGTYTHFANGASVYWKTSDPAAEPHVIMGDIRSKYASLGWETSVLGWPTTDELPTPDGVGRFNHFEGGSIYWTPSIKAKVVRGDIRALWAQKGWERSFLGYPITDELPAVDPAGRFNHFQGGSIYWKPSIGAHEIHGTIRQFFVNSGFDGGPLGFPISDELSGVLTPANKYNDMENGVIYWTAANNTATGLAPFQTIPPADILAKVRTLVVASLGTGPNTPVIAGPLTFAPEGPLDYTYAGNGRVRNRQLKVDMTLTVPISGTADPTIHLRLFIEVNLNAAGDVVGILRNRESNASVPFPTSLGLSANEVLNRLDAVLVPKLNVDNVLQERPAIRPLAVKVMKDNSVQAFIG